MKRSAIWITLLLASSTLVITGCRLTSSKPNDDWKTYENPVYGYSLKYPAECIYGPMPSDCKEKPPEDRRPACLCFLNSEDPNDVFLQAFHGGGDQLSLAGFRISHHATPKYHPPEDTGLIEWLQNNFANLIEDIPQEPNLAFSGIPAVKISSSESPMAPSFEDVYFVHNGSLIRIQLIDVGNMENRELYDRVLSTLKLEK